MMLTLVFVRVADVFEVTGNCPNIQHFKCTKRLKWQLAHNSAKIAPTTFVNCQTNGDFTVSVNEQKITHFEVMGTPQQTTIGVHGQTLTMSGSNFKYTEIEVHCEVI